VSESISDAIIELIVEIFGQSDHEEINALFQKAGAPEPSPPGSRSRKIKTWLKQVNQECEFPLEVLGKILQDFMDCDIDMFEDYYRSVREKKWDKILDALEYEGLSYRRGGVVARSEKLLRESVQKISPDSVNDYMKSAYDYVSRDPGTAVVHAHSALEKALQEYLIYFKVIDSSNTDGLSTLWKKFVDDMAINPGEMPDKDLKQIASGLYKVIEGTMHIRNKRSNAHGHASEQTKKDPIRPRHARLVVHAADTLAAYISECLDTKKNES